MFICDDSQTLLPAQAKQGRRNALFRRVSAVGPEVLLRTPEWNLKWNTNVYMPEATNVTSPQVKYQARPGRLPVSKRI